MAHDKTAHTIPAAKFDALLFDLDGVITETASVHAAAWKEMFDEFLARYADREGIPFQPFAIETEYRAHVDGKPRFDGLRSFLAARSISLPEGGPDEPLNQLAKEGVVRRFTCTMELAWKTLKDYLESENVVLEPVTPRTVIRRAFEASIIEQGEI